MTEDGKPSTIAEAYRHAAKLVQSLNVDYNTHTNKADLKDKLEGLAQEAETSGQDLSEGGLRQLIQQQSDNARTVIEMVKKYCPRDYANTVDAVKELCADWSRQHLTIEAKDSENRLLQDLVNRLDKFVKQTEAIEAERDQAVAELEEAKKLVLERFPKSTVDLFEGYIEEVRVIACKALGRDPAEKGMPKAMVEEMAKLIDELESKEGVDKKGLELSMEMLREIQGIVAVTLSLPSGGNPIEMVKKLAEEHELMRVKLRQAEELVVRRDQEPETLVLRVPDEHELTKKLLRPIMLTAANKLESMTDMPQQTKDENRLLLRMARALRESVA